MKRLAITGATLACGPLTPTDLREALVRLSAGAPFDDEAVQDLYFQLGTISGEWLDNEQSKEASSVASALRLAGNNLKAAAQLLSGKDDGFRTTIEIFATRLATQALTADSTLNIPSQEFISQFRIDAAQVGEACLCAAAGLSEKSSINGRESLLWHDVFTTLLLDVAERAHIEPTLGNDFISSSPCGWLFNAASALEQFLYPDMRSKSVYACGKRLETSLKRLNRR